MGAITSILSTQALSR